MKLVSIVLLSTLSISILLASCNNRIKNGVTSLSDVEDKVGEVVTVKGKVTGHYESKGNGPELLNMGGNYPNHKLSLIFWSSDLSKYFPDDFSPSDLLNQNITATGAITEYKGKPQMVIKSPEQIGLHERISAIEPKEDASQPRKINSANGSIDLYYNSPLNKKPSNKANSNIGQSLVSLINGTKSTLDIAAYGFRDQEDVFEALKKAILRGVSIRLVIDRDTDGSNYYTSTEEFVSLIGKARDDQLQDIATSQMQTKSFDPYWNAPAGFNGPAQALGFSLSNTKAIIAVHASAKEFGSKGDIMHNKFAIADRSAVWTGSCNISNSGTGGYNANIGCVIKSKPVAKLYGQEFNRMYEQGLFHRAKNKGHEPAPITFELSNSEKITVGFSPQDYAVRNMLQPRIKDAQRSIDVAVFYLTHKYLTADLIKAHQRGVKVRVIVDATSAQNGYTKHRILRAAGIPVKVENWGGKMHMKAACIDGRHLVLGSMNWTSAGERKNDENIILLDSVGKSDKYSEFFNTLWNSIPSKCLTNDPDPESLASAGSTSDGIDNDFDGLADKEDSNANREVYNTAKLPPHGFADLTTGGGKIDGKSYDLICGVNHKGYKYYVLPNHDRYAQERKKACKYFPSIWEAKDAGFATALGNKK